MNRETRRAAMRHVREHLKCFCVDVEQFSQVVDECTPNIAFVVFTHKETANRISALVTVPDHTILNLTMEKAL